MEDTPYPELETKERISVLIIDSGARGRATEWLLKQSERIGRTYVEPFDTKQEPYRIRANLAQFAVQQRVNLVWIGQENALGAEVVDIMRQNGIAAVGPTGEEATLESSKSFMKEKALEYGLPTSTYQSFTDRRAAHAYADIMGERMVVKDDYFAEGKASEVCYSNSKAHEVVDGMFNREYNNLGETVIIEGYSEGRERSGHVSISGDGVDIWIPAEDHKQLADGDKGPMTGGMGVLTSPDWINPQLAYEQDTEVSRFIRQLYPDLQATVFPGYKGLDLLEINMRCGSPETEALVRRIKSDFLEHLVGIVNNHVTRNRLQWSEGYSVSLVGAAPGYPNSGSIRHGELITGLEHARQVDTVQIFLGGVAIQDGKTYSNSGRLFTITTTGSTASIANDRALDAMDMIRVGKQRPWFRTDIGLRAS